MGCEDAMSSAARSGAEITEEESLAVRFYMGDPQAVSSGPWRGGGDAYNTINALLHPGFANELDKAREGRAFGLEDPRQLKDYLRLIMLIFSAMEKYRRAHGSRAAGKTCRIDRLSSLKRFEAENGVISGFFSTCRYGFLPRYARQKAGIVLLEVTRDPQVPYLDFSELFAQLYAKPEEAELLIPFGTVIEDCERLEMSPEEEKIYADMNGSPPRGKYLLSLRRGDYRALSDEECREKYEYITSGSSFARAAGCMSALCRNIMPDEQEAAFYGKWKSCIADYTAAAADRILRG